MRRVRVLGRTVTLPDGRTYAQGDIATLEDGVFERIHRRMFDELLEDLGPVIPEVQTAEVKFPGYFLEPMAFYAGGLGGRIAFAAGTGYVPTVAPKPKKDANADMAPVKVAALVNPVGSGKDIWLNLGEFAASYDTRMRRYSVGASGVTPILGKEPQKTRNLGGGSTPSVARFYRSEAFNFAGGEETKVAYMRAFETYKAELKGAAILRPGRALCWTVEPGLPATSDAMIYFEWWELPALTNLSVSGRTDADPVGPT